MTVSSAMSGIWCKDCLCVGDAPRVDDFRDYFEGRDWVCPNCSAGQTLWSVLIAAMQETNPLVPGTLALGLAKATFVSLEITPHQPLPIDLGIFGIPEDAQILDINLTPVGGADSPGVVFPALGIQRLSRQTLPHAFTIHPVEFWGKGGTTGGVNIQAIWMDPDAASGMEPLAYAAQALTTGDFQGVVVPANVAVESKLSEVMAAHYSRFAGKDHVRSFLTDGATYGHQLRFLLPSIARAAQVPSLSQELTSHLQRLRGLRNDLAHRHGPVGQTEAATLLLAAVFGYRYLDCFEHDLARA